MGILIRCNRVPADTSILYAGLKFACFFLDEILVVEPTPFALTSSRLEDPIRSISWSCQIIVMVLEQY